MALARFRAMTPGNPWKLDSMLRLFASVVICVVLMSACAAALVQYLLTPGQFALVYLAAVVAALALVGMALWLLGKRWEPDRLVRQLGLLVGCFYLAFTLIWIAVRFGAPDDKPELPPVWRIAVAVLCFQGAALWLVHRFLREHGLTWSDAFGFRDSPAKALGIGLVAGVMVLPLMGMIQSACVQLLELAGIPAPEQEAIRILRASATSASKALLGVTAIIMAPIAEEVLFRGVLYTSIKQLGHRRLAFWTTAVLFGLIHANLASFLPLAVFGLVLAWLYESTGNLVAPIAAHMTFNSVNFAMLFLQELPRSVSAG